MKFMNMKRFASLVMASVLALSLAIPAFAADTTPAGQVTITGTYQDIPIAVSVPTTGAAQINPYGLPVSVPVGETSVSLVGQKITTKPLNIKNQGTVKLDVNASLAVVPTGSDVSIKGGALESTDKGKEINVVLEVAALNESTLAVAPDSDTLEANLAKKFADDATWEGAASLTAPAAAKGATTVATPAKSDAAMAVLGAVTTNADSYKYGANSIALFRLTGDLNTEPVKADSSDDPWKAADGFTATVVFKFTPHADVDASVGLNKSTTSLTAGGDETLTATFAPGDSGLTVTSWAWSTTDATVAKPAASTTDSALVAAIGAGSATIKVVATLSDSSTVEATCDVTVTAAP